MLLVYFRCHLIQLGTALRPKLFGDLKCVNMQVVPPRQFVTGLMQLLVMVATERDSELIAYFETQSSGLGKPQVMRIGPVLWHRRNNKWHNAPGLIGGDTRKRLHGAKIPESIMPNASYQAAACLVEREAGAFFSGGRSRSAGTWKRARSLCTIAMLSPFLPPRTSLTRLGVPRIGTMSARVRPC